MSLLTKINNNADRVDAITNLLTRLIYCANFFSSLRSEIDRVSLMPNVLNDERVI